MYGNSYNKQLDFINNQIANEVINDFDKQTNIIIPNKENLEKGKERGKLNDKKSIQ